MEDYELYAMLERIGAVLKNGHFRYTSGKHGSEYVSKEVLISRPGEMELLTIEMAERIKLLPIDTVVGPVVGGAILGERVAQHIGERFAWADKAEGKSFELREIFHDLVADQNILIVEDVLNTGGSAEATARAVEALGGKIVAVVAAVNRGGVTAAKLGVPDLFSLVDVNMDAWVPTECKLCAQGIPFSTLVGHGKAAT